MGSTLENFSKSREERNSVVMGLSGYAVSLSRRAAIRHGFDYNDAYQHVILSALSDWGSASRADNKDAFVTSVMLNGIRDFITMWYARGRSLQRHGDDVYEGEYVDDTKPSDPMFMMAVCREIKTLPDKKREVVTRHFFNDESIKEMDFISNTTGQTYLGDFIRSMQDKVGVERVVRRERVIGDVFTIVSPEGISETGTISELAKRTGLDNGGVNKLCKGKRNHVKGWRLA